MSLDRIEGKLPRTFWFLVFGTFINRVGSFLSMLLAYYLTQSRRFSKEEVGLVISLVGAGAIFAGPMGGFLADRIGRRKGLLLAMFLGAGAMLQLGFARMHVHILVSAFLLGLFGDLFRPMVMATIADLISPKDRVRAYGWNYWTSNLGFSVASVLGGVLVGFGFTWVFVVDAATTLVFGLLILFFVPESKPTTLASEKISLAEAPVSAKRNCLFPYWDIIFLSFLGAQLLVEPVLLQSRSSLPLMLADRGISARTFGFMFGVNTIMIVLVQPLLRKKIRILSRSWMLAFSACFIGIGYGMNLLPGGIPIYVFSIMVWTLGEIFMTSAVPSLVSDLAPPDLQGTYQGAYFFIKATAILLAPLLGTWVLSYFGAKILWLGCVGVGLGAAVLHLIIAPARRRYLVKLYGETERLQSEDGTS